MMKRFDKNIQKLIDSNRLLVISPFENKITRPTTKTALKRNTVIAEISDKLFIPFASKNGSIVEIKNHFTEKLI